MQLALVLARTLHFWSVATLFGGAGFVLALHRGTGTVIILRVAALTAAASGVVWFGCVFISVTADAGALLDADMWSAFLSAPFGWPWALRLGLCGAAIGVAAWPKPAAALVVGACFALDQAWLGHAAAGAGPTAALQIGIYWLHVISGFAWVGALIALCGLSLEEKRIPADGLALFSSIGIAVVATIAVTGMVNAALRGVGPANLLTSRYGRLVTAKALLFAAMFGFAAYNRLGRHRRNAGVPVSITCEALLGLAVLAAASLLGVTEPP